MKKCKNKFIYFFVDIIIFIFCISMSSNDNDIYMIIGCLAMLAIPVFILLFVIDGIKFLISDNRQERVQNNINSIKQAEIEQSKKRNESKFCNICGYENNDANELCQHCGSYIKIAKIHKFLFCGFVCMPAGIIFADTPLVILLLFGLVFTVIALIFAIKDGIKSCKIRKENNLTLKDVLKIAELNANNKYKEYNYSYERLPSDYIKTKQEKISINQDIEYLKNFYQTNSKNEHARLKRAKYEDFSFVEYNAEKHTATTINAEQTKKYKTTLTNCTCGDYQDRKLPCKHMYRLADGIAFDLYRPGEKETVNKLLILWKNRSLVPTLIDIFYRIRDKKNKYYLKVTPSIKRLVELELIKINEIPLNDFVDWNYNTNELKGLLYEKQFKKGASKKELIELFIKDEKLVKKLPKNIKHITLNFDESQNENIIECLNYINCQN